MALGGESVCTGIDYISFFTVNLQFCHSVSSNYAVSVVLCRIYFSLLFGKKFGESLGRGGRSGLDAVWKWGNSMTGCLNKSDLEGGTSRVRPKLSLVKKQQMLTSARMGMFAHFVV